MIPRQCLHSILRLGEPRMRGDDPVKTLDATKLKG